MKTQSLKQWSGSPWGVKRKTTDALKIGTILLKYSKDTCFCVCWVGFFYIKRYPSHSSQKLLVFNKKRWVDKGISENMLSKENQFIKTIHKD